MVFFALVDARRGLQQDAVKAIRLALLRGVFVMSDEAKSLIVGFFFLAIIGLMIVFVEPV